MTQENEKVLYQSITDAFTIYESLNSVEEFPDYFEETLMTWCGYFYTILSTAPKNEDVEESLQAKKAVVDIITLLQNRFSEFLQKDNISVELFKKVWDMIGNLPSSKVYNNFVSSITDYFNVSLKDAACRNIIQGNLTYLFSEFLVHHMTFTQDDLDEFEGDEEAFIKMDLEENDKETRRRNCFNLVKVWILITNFIGTYSKIPRRSQRDD